MQKVPAKKLKSPKTPPSEQPKVAGDEQLSKSDATKTSVKGWEMTATEALRVNYVDQEIISKN